MLIVRHCIAKIFINLKLNIMGKKIIIEGNNYLLDVETASLSPIFTKNCSTLGKYGWKSAERIQLEIEEKDIKSKEGKKLLEELEKTIKKCFYFDVKDTNIFFSCNFFEEKEAMKKWKKIANAIKKANEKE